MIAKLPPKRRDNKSSFKALTDYCLGVTGHSKGSVIHTGSRNIYELSNAANEMADTASCNPRCSDPVFHFILSWREFEAPTNEQADEAVAIALKELDLHECQAVWALQTDTENLHVHVAVNRIHPDTYKTITPAKGWTKKALERAARKIEFAQGWEIERSGRYEVNTDGTITEKENVPERKLSSQAADMEAHTGRESLERIAKRDIAPILKSAKSWEEIHAELAQRGFVLEKRGKGAVLRSGDVAVKLSTVSRECSISKLEKRLGEYKERSAHVEVQTDAEYKKTANSMRKDEDVKASWEQYTEERRKYFAEKSKAFEELRARQKEERRELCEEYRQVRADVFSESWQGRGQALNVFRSLIALKAKQARLELQEVHKQERADLRALYPVSFPSFKRWIEQDEELFKTYRYTAVSHAVMLSPSRASTAAEPVKDLRGYTAKVGSKKTVLYCRDGKNTADFEDTGRTILLDRRRIDEMSVLSALQLAAQKWGAVQITGSDKAYRELCVSLALKHGINLANEDLAAEVERRRAEQRNQRIEKPTPVPSPRPSAAVKEITEADIKALKLISDDARIYLNPRTDNQRYDGPILHVDRERGFCVQQIGRKLLFVHKLEKFETVPEVGKDISIFYKKDEERARVALKAAVMTRKIMR